MKIIAVLILFSFNFLGLTARADLTPDQKTMVVNAIMNGDMSILESLSVDQEYPFKTTEVTATSCLPMYQVCYQAQCMCCDGGTIIQLGQTCDQ